MLMNGPESSFPGTHPREGSVHPIQNALHKVNKDPKLESTQMSMNSGMLPLPHNGILRGKDKGRATETQRSMDDTHNHYLENIAFV